MGRPKEPGRRPLGILVAVAVFSSLLAYMAVFSTLRRSATRSGPGLTLDVRVKEVRDDGGGSEGCCRGVEHLELWGDAVKWGTDHKFNSSRECCRACKAMCADDGPCRCKSWVYCGDREQCGDKFGECWLKKQDDALFPSLHKSGQKVMWTSGLIFGKGEGIIGLETSYGTLHIKLFPDCAPHSVAYIVELLRLRHCIGCEIYRAEGQGHSWDPKGNHISQASFGPPYALIQGTLGADGMQFNDISFEDCPIIRRGSIAWVGPGPEFFISLANHDEWRKGYTVFGSVLPEDMEIAEKIVSLPTKLDTWNDIDVSVLEEPVRVRLKRPQKVALT